MRDLILTLLQMIIAGNLSFLLVKGIRYLFGNKMSAIIYYTMLKGCLLCYLTPVYFVLKNINKLEFRHKKNNYLEEFMMIWRKEQLWIVYIILLVSILYIVIRILKRYRIQMWYLDLLERTSSPCNHEKVEECKKKIQLQLGKFRKNEVPVLVSNEVFAPMLVGRQKSKIYLPNIELTEKELEYVLWHEMIHYIKKDIWIANLVYMIRHMFPIGYFVRLYCDEVLNWAECSVEEIMFQKMEDFNQKQYARLLQKFLLIPTRTRLKFQVAYFNDSELEGFRIRLEQMKHYEKRDSFIGVLTIYIFFMIIPVALVVAVNITMLIAKAGIF